MTNTNNQIIKIAFLGILALGFLTYSSCKDSSKSIDNKDAKAEPKEEIKKEIEKRFDIPINYYIIDNHKVKTNQYFSNILTDQGIPYSRVHETVLASEGIFDIRYIRSGNKYFTFNRKDSTTKTDFLIYQVNETNYIKFDYRNEVIVSSHELPIILDTNISNGVIESSLWMSMKNAGIDPMLSMDLADIYAWTIDFYGLQKGDSFNVVYETRYIDSTYIGLGKVLACSFTHSEHNYLAYIFVQDSLEDYFDELGGSLRRAFLKAPLRFRRISSKFSNSRLHPVLKIRRPHHGVDYAAATGTPVQTIGDGKVIFVGRKGGYGKRVEIKHNGTYTTGYAHLSRYAKGLKKGDFVKQGTVIGYVGSTGMSTGPHLDFRVYKSGTPIDPLKMKSPPAIPIKKDKKKDYKKVIEFYNLILER